MKTPRQVLGRALKEAKEVAKLDVVMSVGECCGTCSWAEAERLAGKENPTGLVAKFFLKGINKDRWEDMRKVYVIHNLTKEQLQPTLDTLAKYFKVEYTNDDYCIELKDKEE